MIAFSSLFGAGNCDRVLADKGATGDLEFIGPAVLMGKPLVKGTRLAVELIMDLLAQGWIREHAPGISDIEVQEVRG